MKLISFITLAFCNPSFVSLHAEATCTDTLCSNDIPTTFGPLDGCDPSDLAFVILQEYRYTQDGNDDVLATLLGPANTSDAAALVIAAPHGGSVKPAYIPDRTKDDPDFCPVNGCVTLKDSYTRPIATLIADRVRENYCKLPYVVINELHRSKMDANREQPEATFNNTVAIAAWDAFHDFILYAQEKVQSHFGTVVNERGIEGIRGLLFDVHGYAGYDWNSTDGGKFTQWGYRLSKDTLDQNVYCPVDDRSSGTIGTLTHARDLVSAGESLECLVRGPKSLGQRFNDMLPIQLYEGTSYDLCGAGLPSYDYQSPKVIASDPAYCDDDDGTCHYYSGGYDVRVHERMDWRMDPNFSGIHMNTVQAELPRCIRFASDSSIRDDVHYETANKLSIALCSFMYDLYGEGVCGMEEAVTSIPSEFPSAKFSSEPSVTPSVTPSIASSSEPSLVPTLDPSSKTSATPSMAPSIASSTEPSMIPTLHPSSSKTLSSLPSASPSTPTVDTCAIIGRKKKCGNTPGCTWRKGECQSCSGIAQEISCASATGCTWSATNDLCDSCSTLTNRKQQCKLATGCAWKKRQCTSCFKIKNKGVCEKAGGCTWKNRTCN